MSGGDFIYTEPIRKRYERGEFHGPVASRTRIRRSALSIFPDEIIYDISLKIRSAIIYVKRHTQPFCNNFRPVRGRLVKKTQKTSRYIVSLIHQYTTAGGAVNAAR